MPNLFGFTPERGQHGADLMIVGDSPSKKDMKNGTCFSGDGAIFFIKELENAGYYFKDCYATTCLDFYPPSGRADNVFHTKTEAKRDPSVRLVNGAYVKERVLANAKRVWQAIDRERPKFILALGNLALWFLTGSKSVAAERGSMLEIERPWGTVRLLPTYHPNAIMRQKELKRVFRHDLSRINIDRSGWSMPDFNFVLYPDASTVQTYLNKLRREVHLASLDGRKFHISCDIETRAGFITVIGLAWSARDALVIPLTSVARPNYFTQEEEYGIIQTLGELLQHPNCEVSGQNFHYDSQYLVKLYGIRPNLVHDTMHMAHVLWTKNLPLKLHFLASMFCSWYRYWKDDGKEFHKSIQREEDELIYFRYNGYDCCYTWEIAEALKPAMASSDFRRPYEFQQRMYRPLEQTMLRGTRFDRALQLKMRAELQGRIDDYARWFESLPPNEWFAGAKGVAWYNSAHKLKQLFYEKLRLDPIRNNKTKRPTADQNALKVLGKREPVVKLLCDRLCEYSSMQQFQSLYLAAKPDTDGRMRSMYGLAGTDTFRLNSRGDVFDTGMNLQNVSKG